MDRLDDHDSRVIFMQIEEQRRAVLEHGNELFIADPGRIKEDIIAEITNTVDDIAGIIQRPVISTELDNSQAERSLGLSFSGSRSAANWRRYVSSKQWASMPPINP